MPRCLMLIAAVLVFSVAAQAQTQTQDLILPLVLNGYTVAPVHYQTIIRVVNMSASPTEVTLEAYQNDGTPIRIPCRPPRKSSRPPES